MINKLLTILILTTLTAVTLAAVNTERVRLNRQGKARVGFNINPQSSKKFVVSLNGSRQLNVKTSGANGKLRVRIQAPNGQVLANGKRSGFTVDSRNSGDYTITLKNEDPSQVSGYLKIGDISGE
jgi:hypothetical protein